MPELVQQLRPCLLRRFWAYKENTMSTLGWRKEKCVHGHLRLPENITANGSCKACAKISSHTWYKNNIELHDKQNKIWISTEKGRAYVKKQNKNRPPLDPRIGLLYAAKKRAKAEGLTFDLVVDDIIIPDVCPVLGIEMFKGTRKRKDNSPSVDRFLPVLGYTKNNIRVISWRANDLKKNATVEELTKVLSYMKGENARDYTATEAFGSFGVESTAECHACCK